MSPFLKPFRQLIDRRLWPVALLLVAALVAVPVVLARSPEPVAAPTPTTGTGAETATVSDTAPIVAPRAPGIGKTVLGKRRDPFTPAVKAKKVASPAAAKDGNKGSSDDGGGSGGGGASGGGGGGGSEAPTGGTDTPTTTPDPVPTATPTPATKLPVAALSVRFGEVGQAQAPVTLPRLTGLPRGSQPGLLYLGLGSDRRSGIFLVDAAAKVDGDGNCKPSPENCERIELRARDIEFVRVGGKQYQLEVRKISTRKVASAAARRLLAHTAHDGRDLLRTRLDRVGGLRYDSHSGTLAPPAG